MNTSRLEDFKKEIDQLYKCLKGREATHIIKGAWAKKLGGHLDTVVKNIKEESAELQYGDTSDAAADQTGPCLQLALEDDLILKISDVCLGEDNASGRLVWLKAFVSLMSTISHKLLLQQAVIVPLHTLIERLSLPNAALADDEAHAFNSLLNTICKLLVDERKLVTFFFTPKLGARMDAFPMLSALMPYVLKPSSYTYLARSSVQLCLELTRDNAELAKFIAIQSPFCGQVVDELVSLFRGLPNELPAPGRFWKLSVSDARALGGMGALLDLLELCNDVGLIAAPIVTERLSTCLSERLLGDVMGACFRPDSREFLIAATTLNLCLLHVSEPPILRPFVKFALDHRQAFADRIIHKGDACTVSLRVLSSLVGLHCEDVLLELFLRPLLQGKHLLESPSIAGSRDVLKVSFARVSNVVLASAPRAFLNLAVLPPPPSEWYSVTDYVAEAQRTTDECAIACSTWTHAYIAVEEEQPPPCNGIAAEGFYRASGGSKLLSRLERLVMSPQKEKEKEKAPDTLFSVLMRRLQDMLANPLPVNMHLTMLLAQLAAHPQPLLRDFMLDPACPVVPEVPTLLRTLESVSRQVREAVRTNPLLPAAVQQLRDTTAAGTTPQRARGPARPSEPVVAADTPDTMAPKTTAFSRLSSLLARKPSAPASASGTPASTSPIATPTPTFVRGGTSGGTPAANSAPATLGSATGTLGSASTGDPFGDVSAQADLDATPAPDARLTVAVLVYEEFLKELAALALEQSYRALSDPMP